MELCLICTLEFVYKTAPYNMMFAYNIKMMQGKQPYELTKDIPYLTLLCGLWVVCYRLGSGENLAL